jgi:hypothetical protein
VLVEGYNALIPGIAIVVRKLIQYTNALKKDFIYRDRDECQKKAR